VEYEKYTKNLMDELNNTHGAWFVDLPYPPNLLGLVSDAMLNIKNGKLSIPLLRSFFEINIFIILENTINNFLSKSKS
jgi:hypothetical protein